MFLQTMYDVLTNDVRFSTSTLFGTGTSIGIHIQYQFKHLTSYVSHPTYSYEEDWDRNLRVMYEVRCVMYDVLTNDVRFSTSILFGTGTSIGIHIQYQSKASKHRTSYVSHPTYSYL